MIRNHKEKKLYFIWLCKNIFDLNIYLFYLNKIFFKVFRIKKYTINNNYKIKSLNNFKNFNKNFKKKTIETFSVYNHQIKLASKKILIKKDINWSLNFDDNEDIESLHRFNWLLTLLSVKSNTEYNYWIYRQEINWNKKFLESSNIDSNNLIWEPYTVSERLSNLIIYHYFFNNELYKTQIDSYIIQLNYLLDNLEFYKKNTGNHFFNNLRCLYIVSSYLNLSKIKEYAREKIIIQIKYILTDDFFLREGSSHYHLLFCRWLTEIFIFANEYKDYNFSNEILKTLKKVLSKARFFKIKYKNSLNVPMIGDISPDFEPRWLYLVDDFTMEDQLSKKLNQNIDFNFWNNIFKSIHANYKKQLTLIYNNFDENNKIFEFHKSGWFRYNFYDFTLIFRLSEKSPEENVGHYHNDQFHFCLYYKGQYILVDNGRHTYKQLKKTFDSSKENSSHNSILIDKLGAVPKRSNFYIKNYFKITTSVRSKFLAGKLFVKIESNAFKRLNKGIRHKRLFIIESKKFTIYDIIDGESKINYNSFFYFEPSFSIYNKNNKFLIENLNTKFTFKSNFIKKFCHIKMPSIKYSESYGQYVESNCINQDLDLQLPVKIKYTADF